MQVVNRKSRLWKYLADEIKGLIVDGEHLLTLVEKSPIKGVSDYSFLVFPFAKAYEGFLKRLFLDLDMVTEDEYYGEHIRIGKVLDPFYREKDKSVYEKIKKHTQGGRELSEKLWYAWRHGRNQVFHYFPHNFRKLDYEEAFELVGRFAEAMEEVVDVFELE